MLGDGRDVPGRREQKLTNKREETTQECTAAHEAGAAAKKAKRKSTGLNATMLPATDMMTGGTEIMTGTTDDDNPAKIQQENVMKST
ncbi:hypothetical protein COOONC_16635 [Cooperia oncophora]